MNELTHRENMTDTRLEMDPARKRTQGHVIECDGTRAIIAAEVEEGCAWKENYWAVGVLISIWEGNNRIVGQTYKVESADTRWGERTNLVLIHVELVGEIQERAGAPASFSTGIGDYPRMGAIAHRIRAADLDAIYRSDASKTIRIGHLTQEARIEARIDLDRLLSRHFAVIGSTGVGKSTAVSLIMRKIVAARKDIRILILDPHNEFTSAFAREAIVKDATNLSLPFWFFRFEEFVEVIFRGQKGFASEKELLRDMIAEAKERYGAGGAKDPAPLRRMGGNQGFTADSPVPYRMIDLMKLIDERLGMLDGKAEKPLLKSLKDRLTSISRDPRFEFMFGNANSGGDRMQQIIADIFRIPHGGRPICVVEMSGLPSEVITSVVSVLCRLAFDLALASQGGIQTLVVCEEAHRYVPADEEQGFWPTRQAIARIAKEGRKYGIYLGIVTQRPSELDQTIFSQCNTVFAMRLSNQADQRIIGKALTNGAQSTVGFLASIANREAIAFGEGLKTPMRLTFENIPKELLPGQHIYDMQEAVKHGREVNLASVINRMRHTETSNRLSEQSDIAMLAETLSAFPEPEPAPTMNAPLPQPESIAPAETDEPEELGVRPARPGWNHPAKTEFVRATLAGAPPIPPAIRRPEREEPQAPQPAPRTGFVKPRSGPGSSLVSAFRTKK